SFVPGFEARAGRSGACDSRGGKGERHSNLCDLSGAGGDRNSGEKAGETATGNAGESDAADRCGGGDTGGGEDAGPRRHSGAADYADVVVGDVESSGRNLFRQGKYRRQVLS